MSGETPPPAFALTTRAGECEAGIRRVAGRVRGFPVTEATILRLCIMLGRELSTALEQSLRPLGLNETEFRTLIMLFSSEGSGNPSDLCTCLGQSPANMTRTADTLVERGLITRVSSDEDRRRMILRLSSEGEAIVREWLPTKMKSMRALFGDLSAHERQQLLGLLKRFCAHIDEFAQTESI